MSIAKNTASQGVYLYAHDTAADAPKTGDAANITGTISKDGGAAAALAATNPTEIGDGVYWQPLSQAEANADAIAITWESSTSDIQIEPLICLTDRGAVALQATASALATTDGKVDTIDGIVDTMTAKLVGTIAAGTHNPQSGDAYARIGAAGSGLSAVPWNTAWAAPVNAEVADAIADLNDLDATDVAVAATAALNAYDPPTTAEMNARTILAASYSTLTAQGVWEYATRSLTTFGTLVSDIWSAATRTLTAAADSSGITTLLSRIVGTLAAGTHNAQSGDTYARMGAPAGASIAADIAAIDAGTAPTAGEVADAVWDEALAGHATAGTAGKALADAGTAGDPWSTELPGDYTAGQAGHDIAAIKDKTDTIGAAAVTYTAPVLADGNAVVWAGQSHTGSLALTWSISDWAGPDLTGNTAVFRTLAEASFLAPAAGRAADFESAGATVTQDGTDVTVSVALTDSETAQLAAGRHHFQVVATVGGEDVIVKAGTLTVRKALATPA